MLMALLWVSRPRLAPGSLAHEDVPEVGEEACRAIKPKGRQYEARKRLSDSEVLTLSLFQQLRSVESCRSFLRDTERFLVHLFPSVVGLWPSSLHRRVLRLRRFLEPGFARRAVMADLVGDPETLKFVDSTLLPVLHPRRVKQSAGFEGAAWARWGSFSVYGVKQHLLCATNRVPVSYELTPANVAGVLLVRELLLGEASLPEGEAARRLLGDLVYRSGPLKEALAQDGARVERTSRRASRVAPEKPGEAAPSSPAGHARWRRANRGTGTPSPRSSCCRCS